MIASVTAASLLFGAYWKYHSQVMSITFEDPNFKACVLDVSDQIGQIDFLRCDYNITSLVGIERLTGLQSLELHDSELTVADLSGNEYLKGFRATNTKLSQLVFPEENYLITLKVINSELSDVDLSNLKNLDILEITDSQVASVDVSHNADLKIVKLNNNKIEHITGLANQALRELEVAGNRLQKLDVSMLPDLELLDVRNNYLDGLDISANKKLEYLLTEGNRIDVIDLAHSNVLFENVSISYTTKLKFEEFEWVKDVPFADENFKQCILSSGYEKVEDVVSLVCKSKGIGSIAGIEYLPNLKDVNVSYNNLKQIDLRANKLTNFYAIYNGISDVKLGGNPDLESLELSSNAIKTIDLAGVENLEYLVVWGNELEYVDLHHLQSLKSTYLGNNNLTSLDVSNLIALTRLYANDNQLSAIDVSKNRNLEILVVRNNNIRNLNLKNNKKLAKDEIGVDQFVRVVR